MFPNKNQSIKTHAPDSSLRTGFSVLSLAVLRVTAFLALAALIVAAAQREHRKPRKVELITTRLSPNAHVNKYRDNVVLRYRRVDARGELLKFPPVGNALEVYQPAVVRDAYLAMKGPEVIQVRITASGPTVVRSPETIIASAGRPAEYFAVIENQTEDTVRVRIEGHDNPGVTVPVQQILVPSGVTVGEFVTFRVLEPGARDVRMALTVPGGSAIVKGRVDARQPGKLRVRLRNPDGSPAAGRVYLTASDGMFHAPDGALQRIMPNTREYYFQMEDSCLVTVPAGPVQLEVVRGFESPPVKQNVTVTAGKINKAELTLRRKWDMGAEGWYAGDMHIHANYHYNPYITPDDVIVQQLAEDLNLANMMVANSNVGPHDYLYERQYFEGKPHRYSRDRYVLVWNEEMRNDGPYGHLVMTGLKHLVEPIFTGFPGTQNWETYPANYVLAMAATKQGGAVSYAHPFRKTPKFSNSANGIPFGSPSANEFPIDAVLGAVQCLDVLSSVEDVNRAIWYRILNAGVRVGISAGTDVFNNFLWGGILGSQRVYVHTGNPYTYEGWVKNFAAGRSFASNGPLLQMTVNGAGPGEELALSDRRVQVNVSARSLVPMDRLEIIVNGKVAAEKKIEMNDSEITFTRELNLPGSAWVAAYVSGPRHRLVTKDPEVFAHTSPVYCMVNGQPIRSREDALFFVDWTDKMLDVVQRRGRFATDSRRQEVLDLFQRARDEFTGLAR
jgi:hypothetical protein